MNWNLKGFLKSFFLFFLLLNVSLKKEPICL